MRFPSAAGIIAAGLLTLAGAAAAGTYPAPTSQNTSGVTHHTGDMVYTCPVAGCDYESPKPGQCPMHHKALAQMKLAYTCPKDGQPVAGSGQCPRCAMDAAQHKMASAAAATPKAVKSKVKVSKKANKAKAAATAS